MSLNAVWSNEVKDAINQCRLIVIIMKDELSADSLLNLDNNQEPASL